MVEFMNLEWGDKSKKSGGLFMRGWGDKGITDWIPTSGNRNETAENSISTSAAGGDQGFNTYLGKLQEQLCGESILHTILE